MAGRGADKVAIITGAASGQGRAAAQLFAGEGARLRYDSGLSNYLEVLIADRDLFDAEVELARTRGGQLNGVVQLSRALGGGWQP